MLTQHATILRHHQRCDAIHQAVLDENRFLRHHQRAPERIALAHKTGLLAKLDASVAALRAAPAALRSRS